MGKGTETGVFWKLGLLAREKEEALGRGEGEGCTEEWRRGWGQEAVPAWIEGVHGWRDGSRDGWSRSVGMDEGMEEGVHAVGVDT